MTITRKPITKLGYFVAGTVVVGSYLVITNVTEPPYPEPNPYTNNFIQYTQPPYPTQDNGAAIKLYSHWHFPVTNYNAVYSCQVLHTNPSPLWFEVYSITGYHLPQQEGGYVFNFFIPMLDEAVISNRVVMR